MSVFLLVLAVLRKLSLPNVIKVLKASHRTQHATAAAAVCRSRGETPAMRVPWLTPMTVCPSVALDEWVCRVIKSSR